MIKLWIFVLLLLSGAVQSFAADIDGRFRIHLEKEDGFNITVHEAMTEALPILWKRVVPVESFEKTANLKGRTALVLQFKTLKHGVDLVFNPVQVESYLKGFGIRMIRTLPRWNLQVFALGFSDDDGELSQDLLSVAYGMAEESGFELDSRGKRIQLIFAPSLDVYGNLFAHVDVQGDIPARFLSQTDFPLQGYASYQLQTFLQQVLLVFRDAYVKGLVFEDHSKEILVTIESESALASQVMLEQALAKNPNVESVVPRLFQKSRRQYLIQLRSDDNWLQAWFEAYGLHAERQVEGSVDDWVVR